MKNKVVTITATFIVKYNDHETFEDAINKVEKVIKSGAKNKPKTYRDISLRECVAHKVEPNEIIPNSN